MVTWLAVVASKARAEVQVRAEHDDDGLVPLSVNEIRRLHAALTSPARSSANLVSTPHGLKLDLIVNTPFAYGN